MASLTDENDSDIPSEVNMDRRLPVFHLDDLSAPTDSDLLDPKIPFRSKTCHWHSTWAGTFHSRPELLITPYTVKEVQKAVLLARRSHRRIVVVGSGHSPSDLTCTTSWMLDLHHMNELQQVRPSQDGRSCRALLQAGIALKDINTRTAEHGFVMPNLGSINVQSIAGAIATGTHGSSLLHGILAQSVRALRIVLADGRAVLCSLGVRADLFRAALVSLGALGIITDVEFHLVPNTNIEWTQDLQPLDYVLAEWNNRLWSQAEFVRCWWMPYSKRMIVWKAEKTSKVRRHPKTSFYGGLVGYYSYQTLLWISNYIPPILPWIEKFIFGLQYRFSPGHITSAVEPLAEGLLLDCLYSQFVNEWAIPLRKGPEAIERLSQWLNGDELNSGIPFSSRNLYVHCPVEVRVSDGSGEDSTERGFLDPTMPGEPTLFLNATLYRPFGNDPPCVERYYEAFEWLMKQLGGRPHWAKNFSTVSKEELAACYGTNMDSWLAMRNDVDPQGLFLGAWHRRNIIPDAISPLQCEEKEVARLVCPSEGGYIWSGAQAEMSEPKFHNH